MSQRFVLGADAKRERIDKALARLVPNVSRATVQRWIAEGRVLVDGAPCRTRDIVRPGVEIDVEPGARPVSRAEADAGVTFAVLHEDAHLAVVDKPAGLVVHPARGHAGGTLVNGLLALPGFARPPSDPRDPQGALRPGIVHRLDKDTSGVLVVAKDDLTREGLKAQLAAHSVERVYHALTLGRPLSQRIETFHGRHPQSRLKFSTRVREGRRAVTDLHLLESLAGGRCALVACRLETGRTHQIRVHLAEITHTPVLGDALYGGLPTAADLAPVVATMARHALHASVLGFVHPVTREHLRFTSPMPAALTAALSALRALPER